MSKFKLLSLILTIPMVVTSCSAIIKTPYQTPVIDIPNQFQYEKTGLGISHAYSDQWWTLFGDLELNHLIDQVILSNADLAEAGITLKQAVLTAGLELNQQGPRVNSTLSSGHRVLINSGDHYSNGSAFNAGVSYELDLFGKLSSQTEAAKWEALATEQDLQATAQTLIATTAKLYWQLAYLNESLSTAQLSLTNSEQLLALVNSQYTAGAVSGLELAQAQQAVQSQKANLSQIEQNRVETRTALAVLLHIPVQQLNLQEPKSLPQVNLPKIVAGLPAEILSRRPDLKATELRLRKTLANQDAMTASYYPSISLTGNLGTSSTSLTELIKNPILTLGANLSLPFLQYNDMKKNIAISQLEYEKAIIHYRQTLYKAFGDVENALSARIEFDKQVQLQQTNVDLAKKAEQLTEIRYRHGAIALKYLLDQQEITRAARLNLVNTKQNQYNSYVTLMQALGGSPLP